MLKGIVLSVLGFSMLLVSAGETPHRGPDLAEAAPPGARLLFQRYLGGGSNDLGGGTLFVYTSGESFKDVVGHYRKLYSAVGIRVSEFEDSALFGTADRSLCFVLVRWGDGLTDLMARPLMTGDEVRAADGSSGSYSVLTEDTCSSG